uniref:SH3 domain-containing protein n=1 Tax=Rhabditophanes sp. KR3021 TaxID=114890 RepID=A0AC35TIC5_9BILA
MEKSTNDALLNETANTDRITIATKITDEQPPQNILSEKEKNNLLGQSKHVNISVVEPIIKKEGVPKNSTGYLLRSKKILAKKLKKELTVFRKCSDADKVKRNQILVEAKKGKKEYPDEYVSPLPYKRKPKAVPASLAHNLFSTMNMESLNNIAYHFFNLPGNEELKGTDEQSAQPGHITFKKGDLIGIAGNHWDGYSKGTLRTDNLFSTMNMESLNNIAYHFFNLPGNEELKGTGEQSAQPGHITLKKGDLIGIAGNHWDGYSKGTLRTGSYQEGLFPSYKVEEKWKEVDMEMFN